MKSNLRSTAANWDHALQTLGELDIEPEAEVVQFLSRMALKGKREGLDIGSGIGRHTITAAQLRLMMAAIDISPQAAQTTKRRLLEAGLEAIGTTTANAENLPFPSETFDFCIAICSLNHGGREAFIRSMHEAIRVLRTGGAMLGMVLSKNDPRYGVGRQLEKDCFVFESGPEAGIAHYFASPSSIRGAIPATATLVEAFEVDYSGDDLDSYYPGLPFARHVVFEISRAATA